MELATQSEFDEVLNRHHNIQYVDFIFADLCGYIRGKRVPILEATKVFKEGLLMPFSAFYLDVLGGVSNVKSLDGPTETLTESCCRLVRALSPFHGMIEFYK